MADEYQPAEVLIFSQQDAPLAPRLFEQRAVIGTAGDLAHGEHVKAVGAQGAYDGEVAALVGQEARRG